MKRNAHFSESFWDKDLTSFSGFEILVKRLKDGRQMCKDVEDFLRQLAKIEEEYAKQLHKLVKNAGGNTEIGTLRNAWDTVKLQTEAMSDEHLEAAQAIQEAASRVAQFAEDQKTERRKEEETMKKSNKKKKDLFTRVLESKRTYETKVRERTSAEQNLSTARDNFYLQKELEKLDKKQINAANEAQKAELAYQNAVELLEEHRKAWEEDTVKVLESFEKLEEVRIAWLRNELWVHSNIVSQTCVDIDNHAEAIRGVLECCDVDKDLTDFIKHNKTGDQKPGRLVYEPVNT